MVAMLGFSRTDLTPASFKALSACDPGRGLAWWLLAFVHLSYHTRIVELSSLTDAETTTADDQDLLHVDQVLRTSDRAAVEVCLRIRCLLCLVPCCRNL